MTEICISPYDSLANVLHVFWNHPAWIRNIHIYIHKYSLKNKYFSTYTGSLNQWVEPEESYSWMNRPGWVVYQTNKRFTDKIRLKTWCWLESVAGIMLLLFAAMWGLWSLAVLIWQEGSFGSRAFGVSDGFLATSVSCQCSEWRFVLTCLLWKGHGISICHISALAWWNDSLAISVHACVRKMVLMWIGWWLLIQ